MSDFKDLLSEFIGTSVCIPLPLMYRHAYIFAIICTDTCSIRLYYTCIFMTDHGFATYRIGLKEYPVNRWKLESHIFGGDLEDFSEVAVQRKKSHDFRQNDSFWSL